MKFITLISSFVLALGLAACSKKEEAPAAPAPAAQPAPAAPAATPAPAQTEEKK